ncbi:hypothetical protein ACODYM_28975 [Burkholderia gladioli]|uniref:hypothetical protein n=1 Tax=Burkholderia gladioli TaxID=28095 RepID=UPI003B50AF91
MSKYRIDVTTAQHSAIAAALRLLAQVVSHGEAGVHVTVTPNDSDIGDILTCSGQHLALSNAEIHDLADLVLDADYAA